MYYLESAFDVSHRRARRVMNQPRSTHRYPCATPSQDAPLAKAIRATAAREPRTGYSQGDPAVAARRLVPQPQARAPDLEK